MNKFYNTLRNEEYKQFVEKKGKYDYLSWAVAVDFANKCFQYVEYEIQNYTITTSNGSTLRVPYMLLPNSTAMVKIILKVTDFDGDVREHEECLAIRDQRNQAVVNPDSAQIENTIRRCIAKGISMLTGFGIELWFNEDIKDLDYHPEIPNYEELKGNTGGEVKSRSDNEVKLKALSRDPKFKGVKKDGKSLQTLVNNWLAKQERTEAEITAKYIELSDLKEGIINKQKEAA
jgi:hypothetical protein